MPEINDTTEYPNTAPALGDFFPGTDISDTTNDLRGEVVTFTFQAVMDLFESNFAAPASAITSGTFADARISSSSVTQHQASLTITESQISDLGTLALLASNIGTTVQGYDADTLKADTSDNLTAGFTTTTVDLGTQTTGTLTLGAAAGNQQKVINGGAFTLNPQPNACVIVIDIVNNGSAGTITIGHDDVEGSFVTTDGARHRCTSVVNDGYSSLTIKQMT